jgi:hypothetical protein
MIIIFDTNGGLCNQFYDIVNGINFCLKYNIQFTFRYCSFRNDNLTSWTQTEFEKLFDCNFLKQYALYVNYYDIIHARLSNNNCFNLNGQILSYAYFKDSNNLEQQLRSLNKDYVVLKQFWSLYKFQNFVDNTIHTQILPSKHIMEKYTEIKNKLVGGEPYNFIHYRYEKDFTDFFKVSIESLDNLIKKVQFKNNNLKIFIATSNIKTLINLNDSKYKNLIYKNDEMLMDLNFEQRAFIDYMFGLHSVECYGHKKSSFSVMINNIKQTNNYYD